MTLGFKQKFPWGEPTNFREKILAGVGRKEVTVSTSLHTSIPQFHTGYEITESSFKPKIHTFRSDPTNRWKAGRKIEMVYRGAGYKILDHFNKGIPELEKCVSVQSIVITNHPSWLDIVIDDKPMKEDVINQIVQNDGFDSFDSFCKWFKKDFSGKIIHFTDLRY